jgi:hypothetical protein
MKEILYPSCFLQFPSFFQFSPIYFPIVHTLFFLFSKYFVDEQRASSCGDNTGCSFLEDMLLVSTICLGYLWHKLRKLNVRKTKYMAIGDTSRDFHLEDGKGTISHVSEHIYLGVRITKDGNHKQEINDKINRGRAAISELNRILWDRNVTSKTKTHIYHTIVKSTITYAPVTWCLKAQTVAKLSST